jgi:hypothetical protein
MRSVKEGWMEAIHKQGQSKKAMASLVMLISWEVWKDRNAHIFRINVFTSTTLVDKIKEEVALWSLAGAKAVSTVILQE